MYSIYPATNKPAKAYQLSGKPEKALISDSLNLNSQRPIIYLMLTSHMRDVLKHQRLANKGSKQNKLLKHREFPLNNIEKIEIKLRFDSYN